MGLTDTLKRHILIASASLSMGVGAAELQETSVPANPPITQKSEHPSFLDKLKNNQKIEYNGLYFDTPLFREKQKTNATLAAFNIYSNKNETGLSFTDGNKRYLILMPPEKLESLIAALVAKDRGEQAPSQEPQNPHNMTFQSEYPDFLVEENGNRRAMTKDEMGIVFDKTLDLMTECNSENIIDIQAIAKKYAQKIGGVKGNSLSIALNAAVFKWSQNKLIRTFASDYRDGAIDSFADIPNLRIAEKVAFDKTQQRLIVAYDRKQKAEQELAQMQAQKETARQSQLVSIQGNQFNPHIEKTQNYNFSQTILSFDEGDYYIELSNCEPGRLQSSIQKNENGTFLAARQLEPEEWRDVHQLLTNRLTAQEKEQLGSHFFNKLEKRFPNEKLTRNPQKNETEKMSGINILAHFLKRKSNNT